MLAARNRRALTSLSRSRLPHRLLARCASTDPSSAQPQSTPTPTLTPKPKPTPTPPPSPSASPSPEKPQSAKKKPAQPRVPPGYLPVLGPPILPTPSDLPKDYATKKPEPYDPAKLSPDLDRLKRLEPGEEVPKDFRKIKRPTVLPRWTHGLLLRLAPYLGYYSPKMIGIRETGRMYRDVARRVMEEDDYFTNVCRLPPTFQTWFLITNLYVWILTTRFRALPPPHGKNFVQELVNHFFQDAEDRMRIILTPRCPERILRTHLIDCRSQWAGMSVALDQGMIAGDAQMAAALWRNVFDARGGKESVVPGVKWHEFKLPKPEATVALEADKELKQLTELELPRLLYTWTAFVRREVKRLENVPDEMVLVSQIGKWGWIAGSGGEVSITRWEEEKGEEWEMEKVVMPKAGAAGEVRSNAVSASGAVAAAAAGGTASATNTSATATATSASATATSASATATSATAASQENPASSSKDDKSASGGPIP